MSVRTLIVLTCMHSFTLISVLQNESLEVITRYGLLVPTFTKTHDSDDLFALPYGHDIYISSYPKIDRP